MLCIYFPYSFLSKGCYVFIFQKIENQKQVLSMNAIIWQEEVKYKSKFYLSIDRY